MKNGFLLVSEVSTLIGITNAIIITLAEKIINLSAIDKTHWKCDVFDGFVVKWKTRTYTF